MRSSFNSRPLFAVFDFDGVIVDTKPLVLKAYAEIDITVPEDAWGKPWEAWLPDFTAGDIIEARRLHSMKNRVYHALVAEEAPPLLAGGAVISQLMEDGIANVGVLTGASYAAAAPILERLSVIIGERFVLFEQDVWLKRMAIKALCDAGADVVYVDDIDTLGRDAVQSTWARFVHYTDQSPDKLMEEILWTP